VTRVNAPRTRSDLRFRSRRFSSFRSRSHRHVPRMCPGRYGFDTSVSPGDEAPSICDGSLTPAQSSGVPRTKHPDAAGQRGAGRDRRGC
jgi:hypothetical protein